MERFIPPLCLTCLCTWCILRASLQSIVWPLARSYLEWCQVSPCTPPCGWESTTECATSWRLNIPPGMMSNSSRPPDSSLLVRAKLTECCIFAKSSYFLFCGFFSTSYSCGPAQMLKLLYFYVFTIYEPGLLLCTATVSLLFFLKANCNTTLYATRRGYTRNLIGFLLFSRWNNQHHNSRVRAAAERLLV